MLTYTTSRDLYGSLTQNTSTTNLALGDVLINQDTKRLVRLMGGKAIERTATDTTVASQQPYYLPARMKKLKSVTITIGTTKYPIRISPSRQHWDSLNQNSSYTSTIPEWAYIQGNQILFWPIPSASSNTITYDYEIMQRDLSLADYTTGTIVSVANGGTAVVGSGTSWTTNMAGRYIKIAESNTTNNGDGEWYEILSVGSTTTLTLARSYTGTAISAGSATYTIGQISLLPDGFHECPVFRAVQTYWAKLDKTRSDYFKRLADDLEDQLMVEAGSDGTTDVALEETEDISDTTNPNYNVTL